MRPARGEYPCKVCGAILGSPGALGGHMSHHRRKGQDAAGHCLTLDQDDGGWSVAVCACGWNGPACPDDEIAAEFYADHRMSMAGT